MGARQQQARETGFRPASRIRPGLTGALLSMIDVVFQQPTL